ncbi:MAG TPA: response regulator [Anaeromyxobacteraceae bacterium]|nr:response regulator [Anaeromyxobacteraceae bacterium]
MEWVEPSRSRRVLVVDEEAPARELTVLLEQEGYAVESTADGHDALRRLSERAASVVVLDLGTPGTKGWAFLASKARIPEVAPIPVVVVSKSTPPRAPRGIVAWLQKPFAYDALLKVLRPWR